MIERHGETIRLVRSGTPDQEIDVFARVVGYEPDELVGDVRQGDRKVIVLAEDLDASDWPSPPANRDLLIVRNAPLSVLDVDDSTRRVAGELIAYEIRARG